MISAEHTMKSWDGLELFYRSWMPEKRTEKALLLFHRGHEHSGRWQETVDRSASMTSRSSPGMRAATAARRASAARRESLRRHREGCGQRSCGTFAASTARAREHDRARAQSSARSAVAAWVHDYAPPIRAMVLATPAFRVKLYVPLAVPLLRLKQKRSAPAT